MRRSLSLVLLVLAACIRLLAAQEQETAALGEYSCNFLFPCTKCMPISVLLDLNN